MVAHCVPLSVARDLQYQVPMCHSRVQPEAGDEPQDDGAAAPDRLDVVYRHWRPTYKHSPHLSIPQNAIPTTLPGIANCEAVCMIRNMKIELHRLATAIYIDVERLRDHEYLVWDRGRAHMVRLDQALECDCEERADRDLACAHLLAAMLAEGDQDCLRMLRYWVPKAAAWQRSISAA